jgi:type I restriction enzyme S subunit
MVLPEYIAHLFYYHSQINGFADVVGSKATIAHLPGDKLKEMRIFVPPITLQNDFINLTKQTDKSKYYEQNRIFSVTRGGELCA